MKMNNFAKALTVVAIAGIVGFAATSFAGWGRGGGNCQGQGSGWGQRGAAPFSINNWMLLSFWRLIFSMVIKVNIGSSTATAPINTQG